MMTVIPKKLRAKMALDPEYLVCSLKGHGECGGSITWEHALIYGSRKIQERFAIIPLCSRHHAVNGFQDAGTMRKEKNVWVALNRATDEELERFSKAIDYKREKARLNSIYGVWKRPEATTLKELFTVYPQFEDTYSKDTFVCNI